jgi:hypothetical protein
LFLNFLGKVGGTPRHEPTHGETQGSSSNSEATGGVSGECADQAVGQPPIANSGVVFSEHAVKSEISDAAVVTEERAAAAAAAVPPKLEGTGQAGAQEAVS